MHLGGSFTGAGRLARGWATPTFDSRELVSAYEPPDAATGATPTAYGYNLDKQILDVDQPGPRNVHHTYDSAGRRMSETFPTGAITRTYDGAGRLARLTGPTSEVLTYAYDGNLLTSTTFSGEVAGTIARTYDSDFRLSNETVNDGMAAAVSYDPDSLVVGAGALTVGRDPQNGRVTGTAAGTVTDSYTYNAYGEMSGYASAASSTPLASFTYVRDDLGRITEKTETVLGSTRTFGYTYNAVGRLIQVTENGDLVESYSYDANGNRTSSLNGAGVFAATFDDQDRMQTYDDASYTYSANGELAYKIDPSDGTTAYTYDAVGNLRRVVLPSGMDIEYVVDGEGRRVGKKVNGVLTQGWLWRSKLQPVAELDGAGNVVKRFVYASGGGGNNVPELMVTAGATYRLVKDHVGSVRVVVDVATGAVAQEMSYDAWGRVLVDTNPGFQPFGFAGGLWDADTGLVRFGARDYDAWVGRWTSRDPIGLRGGANVFAYVDSDPINRADPQGKFAWILAGWALAEGAVMVATASAVTAATYFAGKAAIAAAAAVAAEDAAKAVDASDTPDAVEAFPKTADPPPPPPPPLRAIRGMGAAPSLA